MKVVRIVLTEGPKTWVQEELNQPIIRFGTPWPDCANTEVGRAVIEMMPLDNTGEEDKQ